MTPDFNAWLKKTQNFGDHSRGDVVSRVRRVSTMIDVTGYKNEDELIFKLTQKPEFKRLSASVRSQLKRALLLYRKYLKR